MSLLNKQNGITLIALVITIIIMLILAGVSINAIVGDDGIISRTQYSTFLSEMTAVEEAVQMWKAGESIEKQGEETKEIPAKGLCKANELNNSERLAGEIGYYRIWSMTETVPQISVLSSANDFNSEFEGELICFPAGVQDLFYLNNEAIGIKENNKYLIDASTGMIYSMKGVNFKGVNCYSANMATAVMSGNLNTPAFAEAEVSGTGSGDKLAGNKEHEYGFQILASHRTSNIFKLYNNGDLYGKGQKGIQLNTSSDEMEKINPYVWKEWAVPTEIGSYKKIIPNYNGVYVIDANDDLWSFGVNYGLTDEQRVTYTGREYVKIDLGGKKVRKCIPCQSAVYLVTTDNKLLASGNNQYGQLGTGDTETKNTFVDINGIENPSTIVSAFSVEGNGETGISVIKTIDSLGNNHYYFAGISTNNSFGWGFTNGNTKTFIEIYNGINGDNIANNIKGIYSGWCRKVLVWFNDGSLYFTGHESYFNLPGYPKINPGKVTKLRFDGYQSMVVECENGGTKEYYGAIQSDNVRSLGENFKSTEWTKINIPEGVTIKEFYACGDITYFLTTTGDVYALGCKNLMGVNERVGYTNGLTKIDTISSVTALFGDEFECEAMYKSTMFLNKNGKYYITGNSNLMYRNNILQQNWSHIASNVLYFSPDNSAYVTKDNNLYIAGEDSRTLGLGEKSETLQEINNYVLNEDPNIKGKVKEVYTLSDSTYVLLTDNTLWGTGLRISNIGTELHPGWSSNDNKSSFVKLLDDVKYFNVAISYNARAAITNSGKLYVWGMNYGFADKNTFTSATPKECSFPSAVGNVNNIKQWQVVDTFRSHIVGNDGKLYMSGKWYHMTDGGFIGKTTDFQEFNVGFDQLNSGENIISVAASGISDAIMLTNQGRIFGFGSAAKLGIKQTSGKVSNQLVSGNLVDIVQITAGNGFYIAVDKNGKVFGTGSNNYGCLGRWKYGNRQQANSRYRTAFEWVECPELEI